MSRKGRERVRTRTSLRESGKGRAGRCPYIVFPLTWHVGLPPYHVGISQGYQSIGELGHNITILMEIITGNRGQKKGVNDARVDHVSAVVRHACSQPPPPTVRHTAKYSQDLIHAQRPNSPYWPWLCV